MSKEVAIFRCLMDYLDSIGADSEEDATEDKILAILSFATVVGGRLSEYNLLTMLAYAAVDLKDANQKETVEEIVAFYAGAGIISFIDNDLGLLREAFQNEKLAFETGQECDVEETLEAIEIIKESMFGAMDTEEFDSFEHDNEKSEQIRSFGKSFCPKCNESIELTDVNKFVIHYSVGIGNPHAEVTCEKCGTHYQIGTTWKNAYKFDAIGCQALPFSFARGNPITDIDIDNFMANFDDETNVFLDVVWKEFLERN